MRILIVEDDVKIARWKEKFELREVETGLASVEKVQVVKGLTAGLEVAVEDPTRPKEKKQ